MRARTRRGSHRNCWLASQRPLALFLFSHPLPLPTSPRPRPRRRGRPGPPGEAGSLLNVVRYLGISTGIAGASTLLAFYMADEPTTAGSTVNASTAILIAASGKVLLVMAGLGIAAAALSLMRLVPNKPRGPAVPD